MYLYLLTVSVACFLLSPAAGFNIELRSDMLDIIQPFERARSDGDVGKSSSYFGYNVRWSNKSKSIIVGSPKSEIDAVTELSRPKGGIFSCKKLSQRTKEYQCRIITPKQSLPGDNMGLEVQLSPEHNLKTCSPTRSKDCHFSLLQPGVCYSSSDSGTNWNEEFKGSSPKCPQTEIDIMFVLDGSQSVNEDNFEKVKTWVRKMSLIFLNTSPDTQVGVIQYSYYNPSRNLQDQKYVKTEIPLHKVLNNQDFTERVKKIKLQGYATYTAAALNKTIQDFRSSARYSKNNAKVLILLTDGNSTDSSALPSTAKFIKEEGVLTFAVGVGEVNKAELKTIVNGDEDRIFMISHFDRLEENSFVDKLQKQVLKLSLEGTGSSFNASMDHQYQELGFSSTSAKV